MSDTVKAKPGKTAPYAWVILIVVYIVSFIAPLAQFKVTTLSTWLLPAFGMDLSTFGWLMSALTVCGVLLAFPAAYICRTLGIKKILLLSAACIFVGGVLGSTASSVPVLLISRMFEGVGIGLVGVAGPTALSIWFPADRRGLPLGIWGTWMPLGTIVMLLVAPPIAEAFDWRAVFWICVVASVVAFLLVLFFYKEPPTGLYGEEGDNKDSEPISIKAGLKTLKGRDIWLLGLAFLFFSAVCNGAWMTYYPTFLIEDWGFTPSEAGAVTSLLAVIAIIGVPIMGTLSDMLKRRKVIVLISYALIGIGMLFGWQNESLMLIWVFVGAAGVGGAMTSAATRPMAPEIMGKYGTLGIAMGMSVLQVAQNLGPTILAPAFGAAASTMGWNMAGLCILLPLMIAAFVALLFVKTR